MAQGLAESARTNLAQPQRPLARHAVNAVVPVRKPARRALLGTATIVSENPVMLRSKQMEALEKIADKVQTLTVHNGTQALLNDLVSLQAPKAAAAKKPNR